MEILKMEKLPQIDAAATGKVLPKYTTEFGKVIKGAAVRGIHINAA